MDNPPNGTPPASSGAQGTPPADNGTSSGSWFDTLPEDIRGNANITKYGSMDEFARGHLSAVSMIGRDKIAMPKSDDEFREVYGKLGMPKTAADYAMSDRDLSMMDEYYAPEQRTQDLNMFKDWAHEAGLSNKQADFLYGKYIASQGEVMQTWAGRHNMEMAKCEDMMNQVWGEAKQANLTIANRAAEHIFGKETLDAINASGLGRNFGFIQAMQALGSQRLEELGIDKRGNMARTPAQIQEQVAELQAHPAYFDDTHPEHKMVNDQVMALFSRQRQS